MKDNHDKVTRSLPLAKRGRKPLSESGAMTPAERKMAERDRKKKMGFKLMWVSREEQIVINKMRETNTMTPEQAKEKAIELDSKIKHLMQEIKAVEANSNDEYVIAQLESQIDMYANMLHITIKHEYPDAFAFVSSS